MAPVYFATSIYQMQIGNINDEYPTMHYIGIPRHTQSMIAYKIMTGACLEIPVKNCIVTMLHIYAYIYIYFQMFSMM